VLFMDTISIHWFAVKRTALLPCLLVERPWLVSVLYMRLPTSFLLSLHKTRMDEDS
jgi:hypothetical protein